jgi:hypothetical protein
MRFNVLIKPNVFQDDPYREGRLQPFIIIAPAFHCNFFQPL